MLNAITDAVVYNPRQPSGSSQADHPRAADNFASLIGTDAEPSRNDRAVAPQHDQTALPRHNGWDNRASRDSTGSDGRRSDSAEKDLADGRAIANEPTASAKASSKSEADQAKSSLSKTHGKIDENSKGNLAVEAITSASIDAGMKSPDPTPVAVAIPILAATAGMAVGSGLTIPTQASVAIAAAAKVNSTAISGSRPEAAASAGLQPDASTDPAARSGPQLVGEGATNASIAAKADSAAVAQSASRDPAVAMGDALANQQPITTAEIATGFAKTRINATIPSRSAPSSAASAGRNGREDFAAQPMDKSVSASHPVPTASSHPDGVTSAKLESSSPTIAVPSADLTHDHTSAGAVTSPQLDLVATSNLPASDLPQFQVQPAAIPDQISVAAATSAGVPLNGLAVQIAVTAQSGKSHFEIRLDPAELGRIDVRIDIDRHGQMSSHLTVEKPETLAILRQDAPQLQRVLDDAGFKTGSGGLQFSLRDQPSSGQNSANDGGRHAQRLIINNDDIMPATSAGRTYGRMLTSSGGVDIRV